MKDNIVIIGAGSIGSCVASKLQEMEAKVVVVADEHSPICSRTYDNKSTSTNARFDYLRDPTRGQKKPSNKKRAGTKKEA